jgi:hypothetical protein
MVSRAGISTRAVVACAGLFSAAVVGGFASIGSAVAADASASAEANPVWGETLQDGWRPLFDGQTLRGWRGLGRDSVHTAHWVVEDGAIKKVARAQVPLDAEGRPMPGGDLMTEDAFGDFEFAFEWKVAPGANSGVKYNVSEEFSTAHSRHSALGFEYQVLDDDGHPDAQNRTHRSADLYNLIESNERKALRPVGEWNQSRIVFVGNRGEHWLNGEKVVEYELGTPEMDAAFARSKWSEMPEFIQRRPRGHIVLQDHNDAVWFRHLRIRELTPAR